MIAYIKNANNITALFFQYDKDQNKTILLDSKEYSLNVVIKSEIITCEIMLIQTENEVIVCFYVYTDSSSKIGIFYINPNNYTEIEIKNKTLDFSDSIKGFKSVTSSDKKNV